jgi:SAM-dependent methyltransferase
MIHCIVCGNRQYKLIYSDTLKQCSSCGFATANIEYGKESLEKIYNKSYFFGEEYFNYLRDKNILQINFRKRLQYIDKHILNNFPETYCLEIGCAYGFFGEVLLKKWRTTYLGIDIVCEAVDFAKSHLDLNAVRTDYLNFQPPQVPYTDIFMWDVIEHLQFPERFVEKASNEIVSGGRLYLTTGDFSSLLSKWQGKRWRLIHPPGHLHYFSKQTIKTFLDKWNFELVEMKYFPVYRSIQQTLYSLLVLNKSFKLFKKVVQLIPKSWYFSINTYDIMFVMAVKR